MRRCGTLVAVGLVLSGCKYLDRDKRGDRAPPGDDRAIPTSGRKNRGDPAPAAVPRPNPHWLDGPADRNDLPPPNATGRRRPDPETDPRSTGQGLLAGYVVDNYGKKLRGVLIDVTPADRTTPGAPTSVETDNDGSFHIEGLQPGQRYVLSARTSREGAKLAGQSYAQPPNARLLLTLSEGVSLPDADGPQPTAAGNRKPKGSLPAPVPLADDAGRSDGSWAPGGPSFTPPKAEPAPPPSRQEFTTEGPSAPGLRLPATNITPPPTNSLPGGPGIPPLPSVDSRESKSVRPKSEFVLVDTLGRAKDFPHARAGELVLVEFLTTECVYCKKAVPALKDLQGRYGARGLDVIGVVCDEVDVQQRRAVAAAYQRANDLNYHLYVEPGRRPGNVRDKLGAEAYPTMVLLSADGDVLWKGSPPNLAPLERAIAENLGK
jgi:thiol-disulfide isomerase/thioredoxin